jgi:hypothetical protein
MTMDMAMVGVMYAPTNWLTFGAMSMYQRRDMDIAVRMVPGHHHGSHGLGGGGGGMGPGSGGSGHMGSGQMGGGHMGGGHMGGGHMGGGHMGGGHSGHSASTLSGSAFGDQILQAELGLHHPVGFLHLLQDGKQRMRSQGLGDTRLTALWRVWEDETHHLHINSSLSLPTGSIIEEDFTPMTPFAKTLLPYPMQLGSGTWDMVLGATYTGQTDRLSWGSQALATVRLGRNSQDYRLGNRLEVTAWGAVRMTDWLSISLRGGFTGWGNITGMAKDLLVRPTMTPTADPANQGGRRLDAAFGVNVVGPQGVLQGHRLSLEAVVPVWERLDGPQMSTDLILGLAYSVSF